jgi:hypothetical protein
LATTLAFAINLSFVDRTFSLMILGSFLFLISDLILAAQLFNRLHFKYISDVVWLLYGPGQMLIVFAVILYTMIDSIFIAPRTRTPHLRRLPMASWCMQSSAPEAS